MNSISSWLWMTFAALRTRRLPRGPFCVTETVQESSLHSGASKMGSPSAPLQVCSVPLETLVSQIWLVPSGFHSMSRPWWSFFHLLRIPGSRLWLGGLLETMWSWGSSSKLLSYCKSALLQCLRHVSCCCSLASFGEFLLDFMSHLGRFWNESSSYDSWLQLLQGATH